MDDIQKLNEILGDFNIPVILDANLGEDWLEVETLIYEDEYEYGGER